MEQQTSNLKPICWIEVCFSGLKVWNVSVGSKQLKNIVGYGHLEEFRMEKAAQNLTSEFYQIIKLPLHLTKLKKSSIVAHETN